MRDSEAISPRLCRGGMVDAVRAKAIGMPDMTALNFPAGYCGAGKAPRSSASRKAHEAVSKGRRYRKTHGGTLRLDNRAVAFPPPSLNAILCWLQVGSWKRVFATHIHAYGLDDISISDPLKTPNFCLLIECPSPKTVFLA